LTFYPLSPSLSHKMRLSLLIMTVLLGIVVPLALVGAILLFLDGQILWALGTATLCVAGVYLHIDIHILPNR
ncbi:MAG: hypothetical protein ACW992_05650, partial [Candidatus Thorarchaeota archaeon]